MILSHAKMKYHSESVRELSVEHFEGIWKRLGNGLYVFGKHQCRRFGFSSEFRKSILRELQNVS